MHHVSRVLREQIYSLDYPTSGANGVRKAVVRENVVPRGAYVETLVCRVFCSVTIFVLWS